MDTINRGATAPENIGGEQPQPRRRVAVIGGGAAGVMAAIFAASAGADTTLIERTADGGRKILISGGGRCNILPARLTESRFITDSSPNTLRKILRSWPLSEQRAFFEDELGIPLVEEKETGKLFPVSNRARDVRDGLLSLAERRGARLMMNTMVTTVDGGDGDGWLVHRAEAEALHFDSVVIATGGLSVPATGSDGTGFSILRALGHNIHRTYAALTPISAVPAPFADLAGVSLTVSVSATSDARHASATEGFLFTHRGYSGPSVLDVSHVAVRSADDHAEPPARLVVRWSELGDAEWEEQLQPSGNRTVAGAVRAHMPDRLALALIARASVQPTTSLAELKRADRLRLIAELVRGELPWTGHEGYKKAEVTGGGVSLSEVDPRTMESRLNPGLFLCGEILDAFGPIGGYNFCWAWATGRAAGLGAARSS